MSGLSRLQREILTTIALRVAHDLNPANPRRLWHQHYGHPWDSYVGSYQDPRSQAARTAVSRALHRLEDRGLIERLAGAGHWNTGGFRTKTVRLTDTGRATVQRLITLQDGVLLTVVAARERGVIAELQADGYTFTEDDYRAATRHLDRVLFPHAYDDREEPKELMGEG